MRTSVTSIAGSCMVFRDFGLCGVVEIRSFAVYVSIGCVPTRGMIESVRFSQDCAFLFAWMAADCRFGT